MRQMPDLPAGTVTFLFTDIECSTELWERNPEVMRASLDRHHAILQEAIQRHNGHVFQIVGDTFCAAFVEPAAAVEAAIYAQRALCKETWGETGPLQVRMGIHTGIGEVQGDEYLSNPTLNRVSRIMSAGHGGQTLVSQAAAVLARERLRTEAQWLELGEHLMKGLSHSEQLFQVSAPDLRSEFPPIKTDTAPRQNLPQTLPRFIGREIELSDIASLMAKLDARLITLYGMGGSGKTSLAIQAAKTNSSLFTDGTWFIPLAPLTSAELVPSAINRALGLSAFNTGDSKELLRNYLRSRETLLVLDNLEHLLPVVLSTLNEILETAPRNKVLVTSRERLNIPGEWAIRIGGLDYPEDEKEPHAGEFGAVILFEEAFERAAARPVAEEEKNCVVRICRLVEGIPLALELAASWGRMLPCEEISREIQGNIGFLETELRGRSDRPRSLKAVFDYSWKLLSKSEREVFRKLSVFRGGFTRQAAEKVAGASFSKLANLLDKSLLSRNSDIRFGIHEFLRQYGYERLLDSGQEVEARDLHLNYYLDLVEQAEPQLRRREQKRWLDALEVEQDNLWAALDWSLEGSEPSKLEKGLRLASGLYLFWSVRSDMGEGKDWLERVLEHPAAPQLNVIYSKALNRAGFLAASLWDGTTARRFHTKGLEIARTVGDEREVAYALGGLGQNEESIVLFRRIGDPVGLGFALASFGSEQLEKGDFVQARRSLEEYLAVSRDLGNRIGTATALRELGRLAWFERKPQEAKPFLEECLELNRELNHPRGTAITLFTLGLVERSLGAVAASDHLFKEAIKLHREVGYKPGEAMNVLQSGYNELLKGRIPAARSFMEEGMKIYQEIHSAEGKVLSRAGLRITYLCEGNYAQAQLLRDDNLAYYHDPVDPVFVTLIFLTLMDLGQVAIQQGDRLQARLFFEEGLQIAKDRNDQEIIAQASALLRHNAPELGED